TVVDAGHSKPLDVKIHVPVEDMREPDAQTELDPVNDGSATRRSIWPAIYPELLELIREHRSTIVFVNNRRGAERLAMRLNELANEESESAGQRDSETGPSSGAAPTELARAHHGSL